MPKRRAEDAVHVVMTDHWIQRRKPQRDLLSPIAETHHPEQTTYRGGVALYYPSRLERAEDRDLYIEQVQHGSNLEAGLPRLREAVETHKPIGPQFYFELGNAFSKAGQMSESIRWYEESLRRQSHYMPAIQSGGAGIALSQKSAGAFWEEQRKSQTVSEGTPPMSRPPI